MKIIDEVFGEDCLVKDVRKKGKCLIANINDKKYAIKDKSNDNIKSIYEYLSSRNFDYFPKLIVDNDKYDIYEYIEEVDNPIEQKAYDMIDLISLLHNKTTYYKEMDIDEYKEIYESVSNKISSRMNY